MAAAITLTKDFAWPLAVAAAMNVQVVFIGFGSMGLRKQLGVPYPDMGNGRHAAKLSDADWERFNNAQRAHYNYVEQFGAAQSAMLISGVFFPRFAAAAGAVYVLGRQLYAWGYRSKGPKGRSFGVALVDLALVSMFGASLYGCVQALL